MKPVAEILDVAANTSQFSEAVFHHERMVQDTELTPSAIMLSEMRDNGEGFYQFANRMSQAHKRYFEMNPLSTEHRDMFEKSIAESHQKQLDIEAADNMTFAEFMQAYEST